MMMTEQLEILSRKDFSTAFTFDDDGELLFPDLYVPTLDLYDDRTPTGWVAISYGMSNQDRYQGAILHESECLSEGILHRLYELSDDYESFACVVVYDEEPEPCGWTILAKLKTNEE